MWHCYNITALSMFSVIFLATIIFYFFSDNNAEKTTAIIVESTGSESETPGKEFAADKTKGLPSITQM